MHRRHSNYPASILAYRTLQNSGLEAPEFVRSTGLTNVTKGLRHLDDWLAKGEGPKLFLVSILARFGVSNDEVEKALGETSAIKEKEAEEARTAQSAARERIAQIRAEQEAIKKNRKPREKKPRLKAGEHSFKWSNENRFYPGLPPRETRKALFFVALAQDPDDFHIAEVFFVNNSNETLPFVASGGGGFQTVGDDVITMSMNGHKYENVEPGEAVKVDDYHEIYDSDFVLQLDIDVISPAHGNLHWSKSGKGGHWESCLLWEDGGLGEDVERKR